MSLWWRAHSTFGELETGSWSDGQRAGGSGELDEAVELGSPGSR